MKVTIITGKQGSGKNKKAYELIGLGNKFVEIAANNLKGKCGFDLLSEEHSNKLIIDEVLKSHLETIKSIISNGKILKSFRVPFTEKTMKLHEFKISELYILSQKDDIFEYFRPGTFTHIKL